MDMDTCFTLNSYEEHMNAPVVWSLWDLVMYEPWYCGAESGLVISLQPYLKQI